MTCRPPLRRRAVGSALALGACASVVLATPAPVSAATDNQLVLSFDSGETLATGTAVIDSSGHRHDAVVRTGFHGALRPVLGLGGTVSAQFPAPCGAEPCANAELAVPDGPGLDPGLGAFSYGASVLLTPQQTTDGSNVIQKGLNRASDGQWKLQVDGLAGRPSCVVSGHRADGSYRRVLVRSSVSVSDGVWHRIVCRRTATDVSIVIDGRKTGALAMTPVRLETGAPVTIGGKRASSQDNDQYYGVLDDVFMQLS